MHEKVDTDLLMFDRCVLLWSWLWRRLVLRLLAFQLVLLVLSKIQSLDFDDEVGNGWCKYFVDCDDL